MSDTNSIWSMQHRITAIVLGIGCTLTLFLFCRVPLLAAQSPAADRTQKIQCILDMHSKAHVDAYFPFGASGPIVVRDTETSLHYLVKGEQIRVIRLPYFNDPSHEPLLRVRVFGEDFYVLESIAGGIQESYDICTGKAVPGIAVSPKAPRRPYVNRAHLDYRLDQIRSRRYPVHFVMSLDLKKEPVIKDREPLPEERLRAEILLDQLYLDAPRMLSVSYCQELWRVFRQIQGRTCEPTLPEYDAAFRMMDACPCLVDPAYRASIEAAKQKILGFYDHVASLLADWITTNRQALLPSSPQESTLDKGLARH